LRMINLDWSGIRLDCMLDARNLGILDLVFVKEYCLKINCFLSIYMK
jgi:hypothetical protein